MTEECRFFGWTRRICTRPASTREYGLVLCDLHYEATHMDPEDWTEEMNGEGPDIGN